MTSTALFRTAIGAIALHVLDDNFLQPPPGTGAADHLVSGLVPLAVLALVAWAYPRLSGAQRGGLALLSGVGGLAVASEALYYTSAGGPSGDDFTGLLALPAGLALLGLGIVTLWRTRRTTDGLPRTVARRGLLAFAAFVAVSVVVMPAGTAYVFSHNARAVVPENQLGVHHEDVRFTTRDGLELEGWYIPSRNGAAVISFPGRKGTQDRARMLARHGYGVLLFDRRGEGASDGEPNTFGWGGDEDIKAAIAFLRGRSDVDPARIGGIGLSVGGELMLETAADTEQLAAVVSEGAGARVAGEEVELSRGIDRVFNQVGYAVRDATLAVLTNNAPPTHLKELVPRIAPRPLLLIAAPNTHNGERLNRVYARAAGETATLWEIPESGHMGGLRARPAEYERRVIGFFDRALSEIH